MRTHRSPLGARPGRGSPPPSRVRRSCSRRSQPRSRASPRASPASDPCPPPRRRRGHAPRPGASSRPRSRRGSAPSSRREDAGRRDGGRRSVLSFATFGTVTARRARGAGDLDTTPTPPEAVLRTYYPRSPSSCLTRSRASQRGPVRAHVRLRGAKPPPRSRRDPTSFLASRTSVALLRQSAQSPAWTPSSSPRGSNAGSAS